MILLTFENDKNTAIKTETFTSAREQFTCSDVIPTCPIQVFLHGYVSMVSPTGRGGFTGYFPAECRELLWLSPTTRQLASKK